MVGVEDYCNSTHRRSTIISVAYLEDVTRAIVTREGNGPSGLCICVSVYMGTLDSMQ